jgi:hypothetical protein
MSAISPPKGTVMPDPMYDPMPDSGTTSCGHTILIIATVIMIMITIVVIIIIVNSNE